eukprot:TRINITY_DN65772_c0_g1_i1.p3 TRINITY_DN65772_c0_g1~~TRINITY_DN65772_c0_g1_i1.p3  ORF type:complete len:134 (+),score=39.61 TRINITY_DN65772_c0_g1_i1:77-478(+)
MGPAGGWGLALVVALLCGAAPAAAKCAHVGESCGDAAQCCWNAQCCPGGGLLGGGTCCDQACGDPRCADPCYGHRSASDCVGASGCQWCYTPTLPFFQQCVKPRHAEKLLPGWTCWSDLSKVPADREERDDLA